MDSLKEKEDYFLQRTLDHKRLVRNACFKVAESANSLGISEKELRACGFTHDDLKFLPPEHEPYVDLTWRKKEGIKEITPEIAEATLHHIKNSKHHPEYWTSTKISLNKDERDKLNQCVDASKMPKLYLAEMVCDWHAMGQECGNTAREWFNKQRNVRWCFSKEQEDFISKVLNILE